MKKLTTAILLIACALLANSAQSSLISDFDGLNYWGEGANRSALVIQWNDGKSDYGLAWGFNWSGTDLKAVDMLLSLASSDPRLFLRLDSDASFGLALFGVGYQRGSDPFGVTGAQDTAGSATTPTFVAGIDDMNITDGTTDAPASSVNTAPEFAADSYKEGWNDNGFWGLYFAGSDNYATTPSFTYPETWTDAWVGVGDADLVDEGWYVLSFAQDFNSAEPTSAFAAVPEPSSMFLWVMGAGLMYFARKTMRPSRSPSS